MSFSFLIRPEMRKIVTFVSENPPQDSAPKTAKAAPKVTIDIEDLFEPAATQNIPISTAWGHSLLADMLTMAHENWIKTLNTKEFWWVGPLNNKKAFLLQTHRGKGDKYLLFADFDGTVPVKKMGFNAAKEYASKTNSSGLNFDLPTTKQLQRLVKHEACPVRTGEKFIILNEKFWITQNGCISIQEYDFGTEKTTAGATTLAAEFSNKQLEVFLHLLDCGYMIYDTKTLTSLNETNSTSLLKNIDFRAVRQPKLDIGACTELDKGIWELWGLDPDWLKKIGVRARDPELDVRTKNIAIDFGTSSTVVAFAETDGTKKLLRIGAQDYLAAPQAADYENPTVLEFIDFAAFLSKWQESAYRPQLDWDHTRCAHEALHDFRNNESDPAACASILTKLKQWALREATDRPVYLTDRVARLEHQLAPLTLRAPVKGVPLQVDKSDPFDPIELYAWYLGMIINWRGSGIHLHYYMTFPVAYPQMVKDKILASFKRGLQRSFPEPFTRAPSFNHFCVEERAAEPAAFAACALRAYQIQPTPSGTAYAVFDFGGGTTDFDFGFYRTPTEDELDEDYEAALEHFAPAGDKFLGGENLLENMAYLVFQENLALCRENKIAFTQPMDAQPFIGSELLLEKTQAAATNTLLLIERLRPMWEQGEYTNSTGVEKLNLLNREGNKTPCELKIPKDKLANYLHSRIGDGIKAFLVAMKLAFGQDMPKTIHVLLAGNACRTKWVMDFFKQLDNTDHTPRIDSNGNFYLKVDREYEEPLKTWLTEILGVPNLNLTTHAPLLADPADPYAPTAKTGVALGLLDLCPGGVIKIIRRADPSQGIAFANAVGRIVKDTLLVKLPHRAPYGIWHELGAQREKVFNLAHTASLQVHAGDMRTGDPALTIKKLQFTGELDGHRVFGRAVAPNRIEVCTAPTLAAAETGQFENLQVLDL